MEENRDPRLKNVPMGKEKLSVARSCIKLEQDWHFTLADVQYAVAAVTQKYLIVTANYPGEAWLLSSHITSKMGCHSKFQQLYRTCVAKYSWRIVYAAARRLGVTKLQGISVAKERCPGLILISGEDLSPYRQASKQILSVLQRFGVAERLGMDEARPCIQYYCELIL